MQLDSPFADLLVRALFLVELFVLGIIRVYFHFKSGTLGESPFSAAEGRLLSTIRLLAGFACVTTLMLSLVVPSVLAASTYVLPTAIAFVGVFLFGVSLLGLVWVHRVLGRNFSPTLHVRKGNTLVEDGPYHFVRHPMYTVMVGCIIAMILVTGNLWVALSAISTMSVVIFFRTPKEEAMMVKEFGDAYVDYAKRTGAIFPHLG